ncbi:MAG: EamA family transporter [bacterium]|jgi:transporter family protein
MSWLHWSLLSAVFAALTAVLGKAGIQGVNSNAATAVRTTIVAVLAWLVVAAFGGTRTLEGMSGRTLNFLGLSAVATALSWLCYFRALQLGEASRVAPVDKLNVALVILLSAIFLGEPLSRGKLLGGSLIVLGVVILARS